MKRTGYLIIFFLWGNIGLAQKPPQYHPGNIQLQLDKLNVLGSVLYVAAHPDDENTRLIAYFANGPLYRTAYLSATRGDGGQNLIGPEIREQLGIIRTQELLGARRLDGGQQFFSRANDFGYSKHPDETLTIWEKENVLADFVRVIRTFRPDVVITRFTTVPGITHGHHTTSAILAKEAFTLAGDPTAFPEQLDQLDTWQPSKLFWNLSWWSFQQGVASPDEEGLFQIDVGQYNEYLGTSYTELAAESRSMHKSQGFGATGSRGGDTEYLKQWEGNTTDEIMGGIDVSWGRVPGSTAVSQLLKKAAATYHPQKAQETLRYLYQAREELMRLPDQFWKETKLRELDEVVRAITGTYLEVVARDYSFVAGDSIRLEVEAITRSDMPLVLSDIVIEPWGHSLSLNQNLRNNQKFTTDINLIVPDNIPLTHPYWLKEKASLGMYRVADNKQIGKPENDLPMTARFVLKWEDQFLDFVCPVSYKRNDPVKGEYYRPIEIAPPVMVNLNSDVLVFGENTPRKVEARVIAGKSHVAGTLRLEVPAGWKLTPASREVRLDQKNEEQLFTFSITPPATSGEGLVRAVFQSEDGVKYSKGRVVIDYDHIPVQTLYPDSEIRLVRLDLKKTGTKIGYIEGAGDAIPENLRQIGYDVTLLEKDQVTSQFLSRFDAVILGVRAFNTVDWLSYKNQELFAYVNRGGIVVVQYNTNGRMVTSQVAPYPLTISRDRVTVENSPVQILAPDHPVMNFPNKITAMDFEGWVQERGLYFPNAWDPAFVPILRTGDPGETLYDGGLLVAPYGKGYYVYSGISWFRELPAGVPGAYRIFCNLISLGKGATTKMTNE
ncbi:MAG: PIG-L family deacetylase [Cyclobacteriaceae bacterium]|nr:PIG-L family deacetylase [Cyclobacteriaceae bacterium]